ncbi:MAG: ABC transporter permease [bacterium]
MIRNYFKIAIRNLLKHKVYSSINIIGLAIGIACTLLIMMWVMDELSYDRFNENAKNIYRVNTFLRLGGKEEDWPLSSDMMGAALKADYPQVKDFTRVYSFNSYKLIRSGNDFQKESGCFYGDSTFFRIFTFPAIAGNTQTALNEPNSVVITETIAKKYFGRTNVVGETIETNDNNSTIFKITAVIKDIPSNSHIKFDYLFSMSSLGYDWGNYLSSNFFTYLLLKDGTDYKEFEKNLEEYIVKYSWPYAKTLMPVKNIEQFRKAGNRYEHSLTPLTDIHLYSNRTTELSTNGSIQYVYIFSAIALFILLIACINFMNLTTARSANRAREVGIRKVLGTERKKLISQFLSESVMLAFLSMIFAIVLMYLLIPLFNSVSGKNFVFADAFSPLFLVLFILLPILVGLLAGSYPAIYLSGFLPVHVLKGKLTSGNKGGTFRSGLVVFQFSASIILIVATLIIYLQLNYMQNKNLGFNKDQVIVVDDAYALKDNVEAYKNEMLNVPGVTNATITNFLPIPSNRNNSTFFKDATYNPESGFNMQRWQIDYDYLDFMGMEIIMGRNFSKDFGTDTSAIIINEEVVKQLGYKNPIGQRLYTIDGTGKVNLHIIGVVKNFHFESLKQQIGPLCLLLQRNNGSCSFKVKAASIPAVMKQAENKWKEMAPGMPFSYRFMDDSFNERYKSERDIGLIALASAVLAIFVACLGLFGLSTFLAQQKTKEIGIRKTLGASVSAILFLLSKEFLKWLVIANLIAAPIAYFLIQKWLEDFAYRIDVSWMIFVFAAGISLVIAMITVAFQSVKAALANPVDSLKYE